ncbi:DUF5988 family protein [Micromonospora zamorensis]|uniref:Uncharacterized protein n=2 Tax=Micromonospora TaxID=1873 RepID=A0A7Y9WWF9_9ACTN|nr:MULTISPECIES: DUF5988 family protein [Micromonospora]MBQ0977983.1 hypothetical protein [Micromonospora sp. M61]MBQ1037265.1 hypothetical protein [Micromonospora sp. C81]NYH40479.1 hypothetical protein [Micromonospora jinlongensis]WSK48189.1 DUF5988 family protein [Micromonospora zamorensis]WTE89060.1 DUF5988 family protein [Micromonospora zamorensis]
MPQYLTLDPPALAPSEPVLVFLQGGPADIPRTVVASVEQLVYGKIKVPYLAGYEHFERRFGDGSPLLFTWTARTKIAE